MTTIRKELRRLWHTLAWRGAALLLLGFGAVIWPEETLIPAMLAVGLIATLFGLYEIVIALSIRRLTPGWTLVLIHGTSVLLFGALTAGVPAFPLRVCLEITAGWLLVYATLAVTVAIVVWQARAVRVGLIAWAVLDIVVAFVLVLYPQATIFELLYFGAAYAALFGAWQIAAALWLRYSLKHPNDRGYAASFATA